MAEVYHRHHVIPRHAGGTDDPSNIVLLTVAEHAEAHRQLYETHGRWQDKIAWQMLTGQIAVAEYNIEISRACLVGVPKSEEHRRKLSAARMGVPLRASVRGKMSQSHTGMKHPDHVKRKISEANKGKKIPAESIARYILSRQKRDGTSLTVDGQEFGSFSQAARVLSEQWGVSMDAARGRLRRMHRKGLTNG